MSVNGKPFRPDPTSYQMTGIPCGNPKRYKSRAVIRMTRDDKVPYEDQQVGIPGSGTETEAEKEFKKLVEQQMNISASAGEKKVNFVTSAREVMGTASGYMTLEKFLKVTESDKKTNEFRSLGFTDTQIGVILQQEGNTDSHLVTRKRKSPDQPKGVAALYYDNEQEESSSSIPDCVIPHPDYIAQSLTELRQLQGKRDAERIAEENSGPQMSRHRLQLEAALLQGKAHLPLAHFYVNGARKFSEKVDSINPSVNEIHLPSSSSSLSPLRGSSPNNGTDKDEKPAVEEKKVITGKIESIPESEIEAGRKSSDEILKQFPNYAVGAPSKILFVKNLDNGITAQDLVSVFIRFQENGKDKINFKIMDGKMKGQAFITFHDQETATKALNLAHGFVFKNKPMVIQYGKQK